MTERSRFWDGTTTGDATEAPYDAPSEFAKVLLAMIPAAAKSANKGGVVWGASGYADYGASTPSANTVRIATGMGFVQGTWHESDANVDFNIPTPASSTRVDRIVLRKSWSAQTVRLTRIAGTEGAGAPGMTQTLGTTWDVPLWQVSITTGGAITFSTDDRLGLAVPAHTHAGPDNVNGGQIPHSNLTSVTADQHHAQLHETSHRSGGGDQLTHQNLSGSGSNTHANIDTHIGANVIGIHGVARIDTTGSQSLGSPTDGKVTFARANGGSMTLTTPSGNIKIGTTSGASLALVNGESVTVVANGTDWVVF